MLWPVGQRFQPVFPWTLLRRVPADVYGGLSALALLALALAGVPRRRREELVFALREAWQEVAQASRLQTFATNWKERRWLLKKLHLPSVFWRCATLVTVVCLIGNDPTFDQLWTANAVCGDVPCNPNEDEEERITEFRHDFDGRLEQVNTPEGYINYEYDLATGRHTRTCTANSEIAYGYDLLGRLKTVTVHKRNGQTITPEVTTYTYTKVGSRKSVTLPNGTVTAYQYDSLNRLTNLTQTASNDTVLASYSYTLRDTIRQTEPARGGNQSGGHRDLVWIRRCE